MNLEIRSIIKDDLGALKDILATIELFPSDLLDDMTSDYLTNPDCEEIWFTAIEQDNPVSIGYCVPEKLTSGTYNLLAIGVRSDIQGKGVGKVMMNYLEDLLRKREGRILIVETSGTEDFHLTRKFYENLDYQKEAVIRDFWEDGDDKVIYWKRLQKDFSTN